MSLVKSDRNVIILPVLPNLKLSKRLRSFLRFKKKCKTAKRNKILFSRTPDLLAGGGVKNTFRRHTFETLLGSDEQKADKENRRIQEQSPFILRYPLL